MVIFDFFNARAQTIEKLQYFLTNVKEPYGVGREGGEM